MNDEMPEVDAPTEVDQVPAEPVAVSEPSEEVAEDTDETQDDVTEDEAVPEFSWQAPEYLHHDKGAGWYAALGIITIVLIAVAVFTKQWFSIPVFAVMAVAVVVYASKQPRLLSYHIGEQGILVGDKTYRFNQFRSFSVMEMDGVHTVDLDPTQRFQPRLSLMFDEKDLDPIVDALTLELPLAQRAPDIIERVTRYIKF